MTTPESTASPAAKPDWLIEAEKEEQRRDAEKEQLQREQAARHAQTVNTHLAALGIAPVRPATATRWVHPALLAFGNASEADYAYAVYANYQDNLGVVLFVGDPQGNHGTEFAGELRTVADVVRARREGGTGTSSPQPRPGWRGIAEREARTTAQHLPSDTSALCDALHGLTAAVLAHQAPSGDTAVGTEVDLDCEFLTDDLTPSGLVSLGLSAGPGRTLYVVNADMDVAEVLRRPFMREQVWPHLPLTADGSLNRNHPDVCSYAEIRPKVEAFFADLGRDTTLWTHCGAQDVIRMHALWRHDWVVMPDTIPQWGDDLARLRRLAGGVQLPPHTGRPHHALDDAEHQRQARAYLRGLIN
ncbi:hypothetical protein ACFUJY_29780 [Streptomyces sp. NPDC057249]|uniref:hypothetical protein n=1 Tax=Streptomyces sp. NPDC057249 TaxID=3346067 RepID=UPI003625F3E8